GEAFQKAGADRLEREIRWLKKHRIDLVLTDVPSFPVAAAAHLGLPSLVIGNFTWHDIYRHLPGAERHRPFLAALEEEYAAASLQVLPQCHVANGVIPRKKEVGFIALRGRSVRSELEPVLEGSLDNKTLVFLYFGELGEKPVAWEALTGLSDCVFVTRDQLPRNLPNLFILDDRFRYPDLVASSDLVCTKAGYSTLATAFAHGKPVLCSPRDHFHEFEIMKDYLSRHRVGRILEADRFYSGRWEEDIKKTRELTVKDKVPLNGENEVARLIEHFLGPP
ncbi:MAG: hypothetical protein GWM98_21970, partial [Nitrospinaceae bacterium]|nr:hypothetical protein [Nitrospinaceae bacterium]NIR56628.1 hypothetical protein [Nitrospinaceae bacterium]NIS87091.1 hypothetical protein [Nitrospinaceae bacterium]NIT83945.1 hypothetical protein [Nitrospinaceae bacterium]NIU46136.1 hypothetical protein [Nitrospinaceae bacterium]